LLLEVITSFTKITSGLGGLLILLVGIRLDCPKIVGVSEIQLLVLCLLPLLFLGSLHGTELISVFQTVSHKYIFNFKQIGDASKVFGNGTYLCVKSKEFLCFSLFHNCDLDIHLSSVGVLPTRQYIFSSKTF
jgi:hypothetical protein